jgi:hypothetical protein
MERQRGIPERENRNNENRITVFYWPSSSLIPFSLFSKITLVLSQHHGNFFASFSQSDGKELISDQMKE